jgi:hypothetical protein
MSSFFVHFLLPIRDTRCVGVKMDGDHFDNYVDIEAIKFFPYIMVIIQERKFAYEYMVNFFPL